MYSETKSIQKSLRMTQQVHDFVASQTGEGFNQKFENTVRRFIWEEATLDARIKDKQEQLEKMRVTLNRVSLLSSKIDRLNHAAEELDREIENLINL